MGQRPPRRTTPRGARIRGDARGRDGGVRNELAQKLGHRHESAFALVYCAVLALLAGVMALLC
jgi:hypothetical protein